MLIADTVQHSILQALYLCIGLLMVDLHITGRLLVGMGKKLRPIELCSCTLVCTCGNGLMCSIAHNNKARWGLVVFVNNIEQHDGY